MNKHCFNSDATRLLTHDFTFDDILLVPEHNCVEDDVRENSIATKTSLFGFDLDIPIIASPMDTVTNKWVMQFLRSFGAIGVHHRYCSEDVLLDASTSGFGGVAISPSMGVDFVRKLVDANPDVFLCLDVAHGDTKRNLDFCSKLILHGITKLISGNICTPDAAKRYADIGVTHLRVGVGGGSACLTRVVTGFGVPQATAIYNINHARDNGLFDIKIISDGGHKNTGDIIKALALGADYVMLGRMLACKQSPTPGIYRGMASEEALSERKTEFFVEGIQALVDANRDLADILKEIKSAIQTGCYYGGVDHFSKLWQVQWNLISNSSIVEGMARA